MIKRTPFATVYGDACLHLAGGYSIGLKFVWWLTFSDSVIKWTLLHLKDNRDSNLISINVLEYLTVIIDYCAAYVIMTIMDVTDDPHPVLLSTTDNTLAHSWTNHTCKSLLIGKLLTKKISFLLMDYKLGANSKWLSTTDNYIADKVSRLKKLHASSSKQFSFDCYLLRQKYPQLKIGLSFNRHPT